MKKMLALLLWLGWGALLLLLPLADLRLPLLLWAAAAMVGLGAALPLIDALLLLLPAGALLLLMARQYAPLLLLPLLRVQLMLLAVLLAVGWLAGGLRRVLARRREEAADAVSAAPVAEEQP